MCPRDDEQAPAAIPGSATSANYLYGVGYAVGGHFVFASRASICPCQNIACCGSSSRNRRSIASAFSGVGAGRSAGLGLGFGRWGIVWSSLILVSSKR
jgi:hypothetical protein